MHPTAHVCDVHPGCHIQIYNYDHDSVKMYVVRDVSKVKPNELFSCMFTSVTAKANRTQQPFLSRFRSPSQSLYVMPYNTCIVPPLYGELVNEIHVKLDVNWRKRRRQTILWKVLTPEMIITVLEIRVPSGVTLRALDCFVNRPTTGSDSRHKYYKH